jgi:hypothetical protein
MDRSIGTLQADTHRKESNSLEARLREEVEGEADYLNVYKQRLVRVWLRAMGCGQSAVS